MAAPFSANGNGFAARSWTGVKPFDLRSAAGSRDVQSMVRANAPISGNKRMPIEASRPVRHPEVVDLVSL